MNAILKFQFNYFILAVVLFITEVLIAVFVDDRFIRPYFGDFLVVILVYCSLRCFVNLPVLKLALFALLFSYVVEILQYLDLVGKLGLQNSRLAKTVMGSSFEWTDLLAYTLGIIVVLCVEKAISDKTGGRPVQDFS
jgi:hypothetical protein